MAFLGEHLRHTVRGNAELEAEADAAIARRKERAAQREAALQAYWSKLKAEPEAVAIIEPIDELAPCGTCRGARRLKRYRDGGQPWEYDVLPCPDCEPSVKLHYANQRGETLGMTDVQRARRFSTFNAVRGTEAAKAAAEAWALNPDGWLVLHGVPGSGKTHLSLAATNRLLDTGTPVWWWYAADLAAEFHKRIDTNETRALVERLGACEILVLDDLGAARTTDFIVRQCLEPLFNARERHRLPTLVTCIGSPAEIKEHVSESIGRRFQDPSLCTVVGITAGQYTPRAA